MTRSIKSAWNQTTHRLIWFALICGVLWVHFVDVGQLAGNIAPAAAPMELTSIMQGPPVEINGDMQPSVIFYGASARLRPNCQPRRMEWFLGKRDGRNVPLPDWKWGKPKINPDSAFSFGPWSINGITVEQFQGDVFGDVVHQCGWPIAGGVIEYPWETKTRFWN